MRDATIHYLQKSFQFVNDLSNDGKKTYSFGSGTEDITITRSGCFMDLVPSARNNACLEYHNVTIPAGVSVVGNSYKADRYGGAIAYPFFLKCSGTLTVNGVLNMNGAGQPAYPSGSFHSDHDDNYPIAYTQTGLNFSPVGIGTPTISEAKWEALQHYGSKYPFYNGQTYLIGAGMGKNYKWKRATKMRYRHSYGSTALNSSGISSKGRHSAGAGGGFLALYYEKGGLDYQGPWFNGAPLHINANGASGDWGATGYAGRGGGMMVIAAKKIVVGPNGYICCNPTMQNNRSDESSPVFGDSVCNAGGMALMNLKPMYGSNTIWDYNYGNPTGYNKGRSGGSGVCFGFEVNPEYRMQNR